MGCTIEEFPDYIFCYIGKTKGLHGVGFLIKKVLKDKIKNFTGISERVALLQLNFEEFDISIIQAYAPTEKSSEAEIQEFYANLKDAHALADDKLLVLGDFNAKIGQPRKEENIIMGKYGIGKRNERGERLIDYALEYRLSIINTYFNKRPNRKWTWISPDNKTKNEIDFIMSNTPKLVTNYEVLNLLKFPSDHRLLRATLQLNVPKKSRKNYKITPKVPETYDEMNNYRQCLKDRIEDRLKENTNPQNYYDTLEEAITYSLTNKKDCKKKTGHKIFSEETKALIKRRTELIFQKNKNRDTKEELSKLYKETNKSIRKDYTNHRKNIITKNLNKFRSSKKAFKELSLSKTWIQKLENKTKEIKTRQDVIDEATNFYRELYRKREGDCDWDGEVEDTTYSETVDTIDEQDVYENMKWLKSDRSPGPDGIINDALKIRAPIIISHITQLFNMDWTQKLSQRNSAHRI